MTPLVPIALFGWIPAILLIFTLLPPRRAVITAFIVGWLFLPVYGYTLQGLPEYNKQNATCVGILLAAVLFDGARLFGFRPRLIDVPMVLWCFVPLVSNTLGERGPYEGLSTTVQHVFMYGIPYFIGRLYLTDLAAMREMAVSLCIAGAVYAVLCLYEVRMSPQLHRMIYGFFQHPDFDMSRRGGGWRPTVFLQHGLAVGLFMCTSALVAVWLWMSKSVRTVGAVPMSLVAIFLVAVAVLCKSTGAAVLMVIGVGTLWFTAKMKMSFAIRALIALPVGYMVLRTVGGWDGGLLVEMARLLSDERAGSLYWRLDSETRCWELVRSSPLFGFGFFKFAGLRFEGSTTAVTPDGMWLIALVANGLFGLTVFYASQLLPVISFARKLRPVHWKHPAVAPAAGIAVIVTLYAIDNLFNAMTNPIFIVCAGGLVSTAAAMPNARRIRPPVQSQPQHMPRPAAPPAV
jgi:hypothetical protein